MDLGGVGLLETLRFDEVALVTRWEDLEGFGVVTLCSASAEFASGTNHPFDDEILTSSG